VERRFTANLPGRSMPFLDTPTGSRYHSETVAQVRFNAVPLAAPHSKMALSAHMGDILTTKGGL